MAKKVTNQSTLNLESILEEILTTGCLSHEEHFQLMGLFLSDFEVSDVPYGQTLRDHAKGMALRDHAKGMALRDHAKGMALRDRQRQEINRIFDLLQTGKLKLIDGA